MKRKTSKTLKPCAAREVAKITFQRWVRITKVSSHRADGQPGNFATGDWIDGYLSDVVVGKEVWLSPILATSNHDHWDWFHTSEVERIVSKRIWTKNSCWKISEIKAANYRGCLEYRSLPGHSTHTSKIGA